MVLAALVLAFIGLAGRHNLFPRHLQGLKNPPLQTEISPDDQQRPHARTPAPRSTDRPARFDWLLAAVLGGGLVVGAGLLLARPRTGPAVDRSESVGDELAAAVSESIDDLRREPDARRAVIAAYARMEGVLGRHGLRRKPSETPLEYLRRILLGLTGRADAVQRLTSLFEQAKFSRRDIDTSMKQDAIGALREIREDMEATA
jgi:hypothetical protein